MQNLRFVVPVSAHAIVASLSLLVSHVAFSVTAYETNFKASASQDGWDLSSTEYNENYGRNFQEDDDFIESPLYGGDVFSFSLTAKTFSNEGSSLVVRARKDLNSSYEDVFTLHFVNNSETNVTFRVDRSNNYRQFRLVFRKVKGTLRVGAFSVMSRADNEVAIPFELSTKDIKDNSFVATWALDEKVDYFLFDCWTTSSSPWTGTVLWREDFDQLEHDGASAKRLANEDLNNSSCEGWCGEWIYIPSNLPGVIQVGKASGEIGNLQSPALPAMQNIELVVRAAAYKMQPTHEMSVFCIRAAETNEVATFELTESMEDYHCNISEVQSGDSFLFQSFTKGDQRKVLIDDIALVAGYNEVSAVKNYVCKDKRVEYSSGPSLSVEGLSPGVQYNFAVRAVSSENISEYSPACSVTTGEVIQGEVLALSLSTLNLSHSIRRWTEDFSSFANIFDGSDNSVNWYNSTTLFPWQAYEGEVSFEELKRNHGKGTSTGLYAYWETDKSVESYSLGMLTGSGKPEFVYGLAFKNDTTHKIGQMSISYDAVQFGFKNLNEQQLIFEYRISDESAPLNSGDGWKEIEALNFTTSKDSSSGLEAEKDVVTVPLSAEDVKLHLQPGAYCHIRWRRNAVSNAAAMAIDNVVIAFKEHRMPFQVIIR